MISFQDITLKLYNFWSKQGCIIEQPIDLEIGAATFHPSTFLKALGNKSWNSCYIQSCRRPKDSRYGQHSSRLQKYYQFQVVMKPSPKNFQNIYLESLETLNLDIKNTNINFIEDNWESPTLSSWGIGWEVWLSGFEITQFTYFQQVGGIDCKVITGEISYGLERLAMYLQQAHSVYDIIWSTNNKKENIYYKDIVMNNEQEMSDYNYNHLDYKHSLSEFNFYIIEIDKLLKKSLFLPSYEMLLKAIHIFNQLDAIGIISQSEKKRYILQLKYLSSKIAKYFITKNGDS